MRTTRFRRVLATGAVALTAATTAPAAAQTTITFDAVSGCAANPVLTALTTQGFTFSSGHFHCIGTPVGVSNGTNYIGEEGATLGLPITMTGTAPFTLAGFDASGGVLLPPDPAFPNATFLNVLGNLAGGGSLSATFALSQTMFGTFTLPPTWTNLTSVVFTGTIPGVSSNAGYALDNIIVRPAANTVPEPSTYALLAAGLAGVGAVARRRRGGSAA